MREKPFFQNGITHCREWHWKQLFKKSDRVEKGYYRKGTILRIGAAWSRLVEKESFDKYFRVYSYDFCIGEQLWGLYME